MTGNVYYPGGYREDEEIYVYDQSCDNCSNNSCPLRLYDEDAFDPVFDVRRRNQEIQIRRKEDGIIRDGEPVWCIYWQGRRR